MRALLDVNVLIALLDSDHVLHSRATSWFSAHARSGWASCPVTQNGCIRVMSHPAYPNGLPARAIIDRLTEACSSPLHQFWPDNISVLDGKIFDATRIHGPRQLTDIYLLAMAIHHSGQFVTFDTAVPLDAIRSGGKKHLLTL
jgi:toxin-antitoxin system PIN domain toxin